MTVNRRSKYFIKGKGNEKRGDGKNCTNVLQENERKKKTRKLMKLNSLHLLLQITDYKGKKPTKILSNLTILHLL